MENQELWVVGNGAEERDALRYGKCDKYDYLAAVCCGAVAGLVDIFLVGSPIDWTAGKGSVLGSWTDKQVDAAVMRFAGLCGWKKTGEERTIASAIGYLEQGKGRGKMEPIPGGEFHGFQVNYDQNSSGKVDNAFRHMSPQNHHMMSLSHAPDVIGLFFSVLNQFTQTATFIADGEIITIQTPDGTELMGKSIPAKLFCAVVNWFGHIMSDVAGSSGTRGKAGNGLNDEKRRRGSGVVIPFYELLGLCDFGSFQVGKSRDTLATLARKVYETGYDARWGITMSIPVAVCDLSIRLVWAVRQYFGEKRPLKNCIPTDRNESFRAMLIMGNASLCLLDGGDALLRSGGDPVAFFARMNLIAWYRLVKLVFREACIRLNISCAPVLETTLKGCQQINAEMERYLYVLKQTDLELFRQETEKYQAFADRLQQTGSEEELNSILKEEYQRVGMELPYQRSFDSFMRDPDTVLVFG